MVGGGQMGQGKRKYYTLCHLKRDKTQYCSYVISLWVALGLYWSGPVCVKLLCD